MNKIKFLPHNQVLLNNKILLTKIPYTKEYNNYYTIKNNNYA
jgi:hypothetical protein